MSDAEDLRAGAVLIGRFEVLEKLGAGSFSAVYRALDRDTGLECALKLLRGWQKGGGQLLERLRRELLLGRKVEHPGCCRLFELVETDDAAYLTMELISGIRLDALLERYKLLPLPAALSLAAQAAAAVSALHRLGIVHRDLKAANLMVEHQGRLRVMDLGFSWSAEAASLTASGAILGTPTHMAPEYLLSGEFSVCTDVYSLGVLSYQLLTGRLPLEAPNLRAQVALVLDSEPEPARGLRPELGREVEEVLSACLSKDPSRRPADASVLEERWRSALGYWPDVEPVRRLLQSGDP